MEVTLQSVSPVIPLTADPDAYRSTLGKKLRENLTYYSRRLAKEHDVSLEFVTSAEGLPAKLDAFLGLYRTSLADRAAPELLGETFAAFRREVATQFARDGRLVLTLLRIDGSEAAAMLGFLHGGTFYDYNSCYDPAWKQASLGSILQWEVIRHAVARKCRELDMLRGEEDYKYRWGARPRRHVRIQITRDSPKLRVLRAATRLARWLGRRRLRAG